jgi:hypothetical protein
VQNDEIVEAVLSGRDTLAEIITWSIRSRNRVMNRFQARALV